MSTRAANAALLLAISGAAAVPALGSAPAPGGGSFVERAVELGLRHQHLSGLDRVGVGTGQADWVQSGIALGDLDGDGWLDVVACGGLLPSHVFLLQGASWIDVTDAAGIDSAEFDRAPALGDYDNDGDLDLFVGAMDHGDGPSPGRSRMFRNDGSAVFTDVTALAGTVGNGHTVHAKWFDADLDGLLDLYTSEFNGTPNHFYRNNGDGTFVELGSEVGLDDTGSAHVTTAFDADLDGWPDVFVGNDWTVSSSQDLTNNSDNAHYAGQPDGTFVDVSVISGFDLNASTMGFAVGDVNYDGLFDIYQTEFESNFLQINTGWPAGKGWIEQAWNYGVVCDVVQMQSGDWGAGVGWGTAFTHFDLDPWVDLLLINGHVSSDDALDQPNFIYRGLGPGAGFVFEDATAQLGFLDYYDDRASAVGDPDQDGDVDVFVGAMAGRLRYYENQLTRGGNGYLRVEASTRTSAPGGQGTRVEWTDASGWPHALIVDADSTTASQNELAVHFGLGVERSADVRVSYASGVEVTHASVAADTVLVAEEPELVRLPYRAVGTDRAGETFTVRAFAHDAAGTPLGAGANVSIEMPGMVAAGPVTHVAGDEFSRAFVLPAVEGRYPVEVAFDGFAVRVRPRLSVTGPVDRKRTVVRLEPQAVRAGSGESVAVTVVPKTSAGAAVGAGRHVRLYLESAGAPIVLTDEGDGRYTGQLTAPLLAGAYAIDVSVALALGIGVAQKTVLLNDLAHLEAGGPVSPTHTRLYGERPHPEIAAVPHQMKFIVTPVDSGGRRLGPGAAIEVVVDEDAGSEPVSVLAAEMRGSQDDGEHWFTLERPEGTAGGSAFGEMEVRVDGVVGWSGEFDF